MTYVPKFEFMNLPFRGGHISNFTELDTNKPVYELAPLSLTHADQAALYTAGLFANMGIDVPEKIRSAALDHYNTVHSHRGHGNWNSDGIRYDWEVPAEKTLHLPKEYRVVVWIVRPDWKIENGIHVPVKGRKSKHVYAPMPPNGYGPVPTHDGLRYPETGWALETIPDRGKAVDRLAKFLAKFTDEQKAKEWAEKEVSYSYRKDNGTAAVFRVFYTDYGPFYEDAGWGGGYRDGYLGAFPLGSSAKKK